MWTAALALCFTQELAFRWTVDVEDRFWQALHVLEVEEQPLAAADLLDDLVKEPSVVQDPGQTGYVLAQRYRALRLADRHEEARVLLPRLRQAVSGTDFAAPAERLVVQADRMSSGGLQVDEALLQLLLEATEQGGESLEALLAGYGDRLTPEILRVLDRPSLFTEQFDRPESAMHTLWVQVWKAGTETVLGEMSARIENRSVDYLSEVQFDCRWYSEWQLRDAHSNFLIQLSLDQRPEVASQAVPTMVKFVERANVRERLQEILENEEILAPFLLESLIRGDLWPHADQEWIDSLVNSVLSRPGALREVARDLSLKRMAPSPLYFLATEFDDRDAQRSLLTLMLRPQSKTVEFRGEQHRLGVPESVTRALSGVEHPLTRVKNSLARSWAGDWPQLDLRAWRRSLAKHADEEIRVHALISCLYSQEVAHGDAAHFIEQGVVLPDLMRHVAVRHSPDALVWSQLEGSLETDFDRHLAFEWAASYPRAAFSSFSADFWADAPQQDADLVKALKRRVVGVSSIYEEPAARKSLWYLLEHPELGLAGSLREGVVVLMAALDKIEDPVAELDRVLKLIADRGTSPLARFTALQVIQQFLGAWDWESDARQEQWLAMQYRFLPTFLAQRIELEGMRSTAPSDEIESALASNGSSTRVFNKVLEQADQRGVEVDFISEVLTSTPGLIADMKVNLHLSNALKYPDLFRDTLGPVFLNREYDENLRISPSRGPAVVFPLQAVEQLLESGFESGIRAFWRSLPNTRVSVEPAISDSKMLQLALRDAQHPKYANFALSYLSKADIPSEQWASLATDAWADHEFGDRLQLIRQIGQRYEPSLVSILLEAQVSQEFELADAADDALIRYKRIRESQESWGAWQRQGREGSPIDSLVERTASDRAQKVRLAAIQALGTLEAKEALPFLVELLEDPDQAVVAAAEEAMTRIHRASTEPIDD